MGERPLNAAAATLSAIRAPERIASDEDFLHSDGDLIELGPDHLVVETAVEDVRRIVREKLGDDTAVEAMSSAVVDANEVRAHAIPFSDGSSRVLVRTALLSLCRAYSYAVARLFKQSSSGMRSTWKLMRGAAPEHYAVLAAMARTYHLNQRVHQSPGKLQLVPARRVRGVMDKLMLGSVRFVVAHEVAHLLTEGHLNWTQAGEHRPGKDVVEIGADYGPETEFEADQLALHMVASCLERESNPRPYPLAVMMATIAMRAMATTENCDMVRTATTHPSAATRLARLHEDLRHRTNRVVHLITDNIRLADATASDMQVPIPDAYWVRLLDDPGVDSDGLRERIDEVRHADAVLCGPPEERLDLVRRFTGRPWLAAPIRSQSDVIERLRAIEMSPDDIEILVDPRYGLTHAEINRLLQKRLRLPPPRGRLAVAALGSIYAPHLAIT